MVVVKTHNKTHTILPLAIIGIASSFVFVFTALASGIVPADVIALANSARAKANLIALTENAKLSLAAQNKADDMLRNDYFAHTSPKGVEPWHWIKEAGYQYQAAGENLAINYTDAKDQHSAWMKSETHRANILNTRYREIGVAVAKGKINGKESLVTVELFGTPLVGVIDKKAPVPVALAPAEIMGIETEVLPIPEAPIAVQTTPQSVITPAPVLLSQTEMFLSGEQLYLIWFSIFFLSILAAPLALLLRGFGFFLRKELVSAKKIEKTGKTESLVAIPVATPLNIDSIHQHLSAH